MAIFNSYVKLPEGTPHGFSPGHGLPVTGRSRMAGRQIRLKRAELRLLRISELRRLMDALGISGEGHPGKTRAVKAKVGHGLFMGIQHKIFGV